MIHHKQTTNNQIKDNDHIFGSLLLKDVCIIFGGWGFAQQIFWGNGSSENKGFLSVR